MAVGDPWDLRASLTYQGPGRLTFSTYTSPTALLVQDGVVVGSLLPPVDDDWAEADIGSGLTLGFSTSQAPLMCVPGTYLGDGGDDLAPGTYEVYPAVWIGGPSVRVDGSLEELDGLSLGGQPSTVVVE